MSSVLEQKCPNCGATTHFDPKKQKLVCDYCDTAFPFDINKVQAESFTEDFNFEDFRKGYEQPNAEKLPIYLCKSCGAELIAPPEQISLTCPYCRNNIVLSDKVSGNLRPNGILPFKVTAEELPERLRAFYKDKKLLPKRFFSEAAMSGVTGVYVPFWLFSGSVDGNATFVTSRVDSHSEGNYYVTDTSYYEVESAVHAVFCDVPVDASKRISDKLMDSLEPFDMTAVQPFDVGYLAGYTADRFDTPSEDIESRARERIENTANAVLAVESGSYDKARRSGGSLKTDLTAQYYLLPVYLFQLKYLKKNYSFAVNGHSGKIVGELPDSKLLKRMCFLKWFLPVACGILAAFIIRYFLGG